MTDSVVLLSIDSLRSDYLTPVQFPTCWSLFDSEFVRFARAYSHGVATPFAFPGIHAGVPPTGDGSLPKTASTLAELVDSYAVGYPNNPHLFPGRGYDRGFDEYRTALLDETSRLQTLANAVFDRLPVTQTLPDYGYTVAETLREDLIEAMKAHGPGLYWGHFMDPHYPFYPHSMPNYKFNNTPSIPELKAANSAFSQQRASEDQLCLLRSVYRENVHYLDRELGTLLNQMQDLEWWDDSLVIIVADHGEAFGEHGIQNHQWDSDPIDTLVQTPLLVKYPASNNGGKQCDHLVQHADIKATIADHIGVKRPEGAYPLNEETDRRVISKSNFAVRGISADGWLIKRRDGTSDENGSPSDELRADIDAASYPSIESLSGDAIGVPDDEADALKQQLEDLGYLN